MLPLLAALILSILPATHSPVCHVDLIEINHFHDTDGKEMFQQAIFYDWDAITNRHQVVHWVLIKERNPLFVNYTDMYVTVRPQEPAIHVKAKYFRETWTQYDVELVEREKLPKEQRKGLR